MEKIRNYKDEDYETLLAWFEGWDSPAFAKAGLSTTGFIVPEVAAGFLYLTNCEIAFIDGYISNPKASKADRRVALDEISHALIIKAKECGYSYIKCDTTFTAVKTRAKAFGFQSIGLFEGFIKSLKEI